MLKTGWINYCLSLGLVGGNFVICGNCDVKFKFLTMSILRIIFAIILPPLGVFLTVGIRGAFWLNILLTLLGFIPGIVHAVWVIAKHDKT